MSAKRAFWAMDVNMTVPEIELADLALLQDNVPLWVIKHSVSAKKVILAKTATSSALHIQKPKPCAQATASVKLHQMVPKQTASASRALLAVAATKDVLWGTTSSRALGMENAQFSVLRVDASVTMVSLERIAASTHALLQMQFTTKSLRNAFALWVIFAVSARGSKRSE